MTGGHPLSAFVFPYPAVNFKTAKKSFSFSRCVYYKGFSLNHLLCLFAMSRATLRAASALVVLSSLSLSSMAAGTATSSAPLSVPLPALVMRTGEHPSFDRVVFDGPMGMGYKLSREGDRVTLAFSKAAKVVFARDILPRAQHFHITQGADGGSPLVVQFSVAPKATLKDFMSGTSIVVDVFGGVVPASTQEPARAVKEQKESEGQKKEQNTVAEAQKEAASPSQISPTPLPPKGAEPPVKVAPPVPSPVKAASEAPAPALAPAEPVSSPAAAPSFPPDTVAPTPQAAPVHPIDTAVTNLPSEPQPFVAPVIQIDPKVLTKIHEILAETDPRPVAVFDPKVQVGAAIFVRGGYVTILFDRKLTGDSLLLSPPPRLELEPLVLPRNTGFRIAVPEGVGVRSTRKGTAWEVYLTTASTPPALSTGFIAQPEFALGARLLVSTPDPPPPVFFPDPVVGDDLIVLPLREPGAFSIGRQLADFNVIPAAQGLVIKPWHNRVVARVVPDGVEITAEGGLKLSPPEDTGVVSPGGQTGEKAYKPLFDFEHWRGRAGNSFTQTRQALMQTVIDVKEDERILARLDLARFYFAQGDGREALAILAVIQKSLPEIESQPDFLAVRGGAYVLAGNAQAALDDLNNPALAGQPEVILWKAVASANLRDWPAAFDGFNTSWTMLSDYIEPFRSRFSILAMESAVATGHDDKVAQWIAEFEKRGYVSAVEPALLYLKGVMFSKGGRADMAEKMWRRVVKGGDRLYKIRAELALIDLGVATKSLTPKQAVDRLEGLRFAWRSDDLELDILTRLGWFYMDTKDFRKGFEVLTEALRLFPQAPTATRLRADMTRTFHDLYMTDLGKTLSPIDALTLFTEYKELLPSGEDGNDVRKNLAERLIDIDLLDPASKLLKDIIKNSTKPEERVKISTRLAAVSLLDHKAADALKYLDQSEDEAKLMGPTVVADRQLLRVRALSELGKYDDAIKAFPEQNSKAAMLLRADIAMRARKWSDASQALMVLIGPPAQDGVPFSEEKAGWLVNAAMCSAQSGDTGALDRLAIDYGKAMEKTSKANIFHILTQPEKLSQIKDLRTAQSKLGEVDMFRDVLDSYRSVQSK